MTRKPTVAILTLGTTLALAAVTIAPGVRAADPPEPKATVPEPVKDFGTVDKGVQLTHSFEIRNQGAAPLKIDRVVPACGCTVARFDREIPPGGSGQVHAEVDTSTLSGATSRDIEVYTNAPNSPRLRLTFKANVIVHLRVTPGFARYQVVHGEEQPGVLKQTIWAGDGSEWKVLGIESPWPYLTTRYRPATAEERVTSAQAKGAQWVVEMDLAYNQAPVGALAQELIVNTDHPTQKVIRIPVSGFVRPTLWATPHEIDLGEVKIEEPLRFSVVVQNFLADPVNLTEVSSDLKLTGSVVALQDGRRYDVQITMSPDMPKGPFDGKIRIKTSTEKMPVVEVPLKGKVL
jgi:hypothetical protein